MKQYNVKVVLTEPMLGTASGSKDVHEEYIAVNAPTEEMAKEEVEALPVEDTKELPCTVFHRTDDGKPFVFDYWCRGFFKEACGMLRRVPGTESAKLTNYKKVIDGLVFVFPRRLVLELSGPLTWNQRPLRGQTAQGERISLAKSEQAPVGTRFEFTIKTLNNTLVGRDTLEEWLSYGALKGFGQWRNASYGRFDYEIEEVKE